MYVKMTASGGRVVHAPSIDELIVLRCRHEALIAAKTPLLFLCRRNVTVSIPSADNCSLAHCIEHALEWCDLNWRVDIRTAAPARLALDIRWCDMHDHGTCPLVLWGMTDVEILGQ